MPGPVPSPWSCHMSHASASSAPPYTHAITSIRCRVNEPDNKPANLQRLHFDGVHACLTTRLRRRQVSNVSRIIITILSSQSAPGLDPQKYAVVRTSLRIPQQLREHSRSPCSIPSKITCLIPQRVSWEPSRGTDPRLHIDVNLLSC